MDQPCRRHGGNAYSRRSTQGAHRAGVDVWLSRVCRGAGERGAVAAEPAAARGRRQSVGSFCSCQRGEGRAGHPDAQWPITLRSGLGPGLSARARTLFSDGPTAPFGRGRAVGACRPRCPTSGQGRAPASLPPSRRRRAGRYNARGAKSLGCLCRGREPGARRSLCPAVRISAARQEAPALAGGGFDPCRLRDVSDAAGAGRLDRAATWRRDRSARAADGRVSIPGGHEFRRCDGRVFFADAGVSLSRTEARKKRRACKRCRRSAPHSGQQ